MRRVRRSVPFLVGIFLPLIVLTQGVSAEIFEPNVDTVAGAPLKVGGTSIQAGGVEGAQESLGCLGCAMTLEEQF